MGVRRARLEDLAGFDDEKRPSGGVLELGHAAQHRALLVEDLGALDLPVVDEPRRARSDLSRAHAQFRIPKRLGHRNVRNSFEGKENAALMRAHRHDAHLSRLVRTAGEADS